MIFFHLSVEKYCFKTGYVNTLGEKSANLTLDFCHRDPCWALASILKFRRNQF